MPVFLICLSSFLFECYGDHRDLHVLTHSFPTRRSSDLTALLESGDQAMDARFRFEPQRVLHLVEGRAHSGVPEPGGKERSEEHTSEPPVTNAQLVCRLLLEKKKTHMTWSENDQKQRQISAEDDVDKQC